MKNLHKKKVSVLGKQIPVLLIAIVAVMGIGTAALLPYFGQITGMVSAQQSVLVDDGDHESTIEDVVDEDAPGGERFCFTHELENQASVPATVELENHCEASDGAIDCEGANKEHFDLSDHVLDPVTTACWDDGKTWDSTGEDECFDHTSTYQDDENNDYFGWDSLGITKEHQEDCGVEFVIDMPRVLESFSGNQDNFALLVDADNDSSPDWQLIYDGNEDSHEPEGDHWSVKYYDGSWSGNQALPTNGIDVSTSDQKEFSITIDGDMLGNQNGKEDDCGLSYKFALMTILNSEGVPSGEMNSHDADVTIWYPEEPSNVWTDSSDYEEETLGNPAGQMTIPSGETKLFANCYDFHIAIRPGTYDFTTNVVPVVEEESA